MDTVLSDVRYALRVLWRNPGFTSVAVVTLALGIGANTTMFGVVNATLLRPIPFPQAERLVMIWEGEVADPTDLNIVSWPNFRDFREQSRTLESMAFFDSAGRGYNLGGGSEPEQVSGVRVTASFFATLGVSPMLGRGFLAEEETAGRDKVVVLSHGLWTRRYGADPALVGKTIKIDGADFTVAGVMPPSFAFQFWSGPRELWVPVGFTDGDQARGSHSFVAFGRIKPGVTLAEARAEMDTIGRRVSDQYSGEIGRGTVRLEPMNEVGVGEVRTALLALLGVVGFVLLIACVNVANLMLARAAVRHKELAVRSAMGAGRWRIVRQLLTESVILGLLGGLAGLVIAVWTTSLLPSFLPGTFKSMPLRPLRQIGVDGVVLAFTFGVSCLTGILFGLVPAVAAFRGNLNETLKDTARGSTQGSKGRLRHALVASEVALTLVVLAGAGLMIASVSRLLGVDPGLDPKNVLVMEMSLPQIDLYYGPPVHARFCEDLQEQVGSVPGVLSVSTIGHLPLSGGNAGRGLFIEGKTEPGAKDQPGANYSVACPNLLKTLGIGLVSGREFTAQDDVSAPQVILINEAMARKFWPNEDALGKRVKITGLTNDAPWMTVVGIYRDMRNRGLAAEVRQQFLRPYSQAGWPFVSIVVKTAAAPRAFIEPVKKALLRVEPDQAVAAVRTMEEVVSGSVAAWRFPMMLLSGLAVLALALATVGIAGVVGYSVVQRTQEIGIRMALGAESKDVLGLVVGGSLAWALGGVAAGVLLSFAALRPLQSLLYGVTSTNPLVLAGVSVVLMAVAAAASYLPARRAARVDPVVALRCE